MLPRGRKHPAYRRISKWVAKGWQLDGSDLAHIEARLVLGGARQLSLFDSQPSRALVPVRQPERAFHLSFGWPQIIGVEVTIIGSDPDAPLFYAPTQSMRPSAVLSIAPEQMWKNNQWGPGPYVQIVEQPGPLAFVSSVPRVGIILLAVGLVWWVWLVCGGEALAIRAGGWTGDLLILAPLAFCLLAGYFWLKNIWPDMDLLASEWQCS